MAKMGRRRLAREVVRLLIQQPERRAELTQQLAGYLVAHKLTKQVDLLMQDIADELFVQQKHITATVELAHNMTEQIHAAVHDLLTTATGAQSVELQTVTVPDIFGGVIVRTPRQELDASVKRQLKVIAGGIK